MTDEPQVIVALRLPQSQKTWLQEQAKQQERSMNYVARRLFEQAIAARQEKVK